ncbi:MAG: TonB-dependent receptor [Williamsia sp.]|nr:TonB-dependent receptor [Williamsia sp.]
MRKVLYFFAGALCLCMQAFAQSRPITGRVVDEGGNPIAHATIQIKGAKSGTSSASDGSFTLTVPADVEALVVSSVSFTPQELRLGKNTSFVTAQLKAATGSLSEVVVVGYGTQRKSENTAAVAKVGGEKVANIPFTSVDQPLQGKVAGLQSVTSSGQPGANQQIRIRGVGSYTASSQPLFVIDGTQINSGDLSRNTSTTNVLANINPDDIESISVLKDAAATAIYGARGSNGVIVITTKRGKAGKTQFKFVAEAGQNRHGDIPDAGKPLRAKDWLSLYREGYANSYAASHPTDPYSLALLKGDTAALTYGDGTVDTDWLTLLTRAGTQQQYNISASGGDEKTKFYISGGYFKQAANVIGSDLTRYSAIINFDHAVSKKLSFSFNLQPTYSRQNTPLQGSSYFANPVSEIFFARPTSNPYNADGSYNISTATKDFPTLYNPLYINAYDIRWLNNTSAYGKAEGKYNILDNLSFTSRMGLQMVYMEEFQYNNPNHGDGKAAKGRGYAYNERYFLYDWTNQVDYRANLTRNKDLVLNAKAGYEAISSKGYFVTGASTNYPTATLVDAANAATPTIGSNSGSDYTFASLFGNATISYKGKYVLSGNLRQDGSSRFPFSNQYGLFPSASIAWNASKEDFLSNSDLISDLKVRASYGSSGNAELGNYGWRQTFGYGLNYNGSPGGGFNNIGNRNLQWESSKQTDLGVDASFLQNRLSVTVDLYKKVIDHLIFSAPISYTTGFTSINENIGAMRNQGIEITINATPVRTRDFSWDLNFNFTANRNKITSIVPGQTQLINGQFLIKPGYDINTFYMREWAGVDPNNGDPLWYIDSSHKGTTNNYNAAQRTPTGKTSTPKYYGGFSNTFTYKGLSLTADLYYNYGNYVLDSWAQYFYDEVSPAYGKYAINLTRWQKPGDITTVPKLVYNSSNNSASTSTRFLYRGDYIRLRNVSLGYTLPASLIKSLRLSNLNVYVRGTNLWTHRYDKNIPFDPEQGINSNTTALNVFYNKSVTAGINLGF